MSQPYDINAFDNPLFTVDNVLFTIKEKRLMILMVKRANDPYKGRWGLPGGFVDTQLDDSIEMTALRKLKEKTNISVPYLEQLEVFSGLNRDPRGFSVTAVFYALTSHQSVSSYLETIADVQWIDIQELNSLPVAFDHKLIIKTARDRLEQKALYSMVPVYCLPELFTIGQLKSVIEIIIGKTIQRKSLIRRIEASNMFETIDQKIKSGGRLAQVYQLKENVEIAHFERNFSN
ncbi:NrtR DNA-binding winged helix domain-containing protein [Marinicellulosiphila megalodicopiae]|uniref:NrtR DNA-binding winged helix domain-containing protein n=1 Tax=Marinicellulosiphila megalodicopiae TaxID=2724896 RepID=UPI003BAEFB05